MSESQAGFSLQREINSYYQKYLGRDADQAGMDYWLGTIGRGSTLANVERDIASSKQAQEYQIQQALDESSLLVDTTASSGFSLAGGDSGESAAVDADAGAGVGNNDDVVTDIAADTTNDANQTVDSSTDAFPTADTGQYGDMIDASATFAAANQYLGVSEAQWSAFVDEVNDIKAQMNAFEGNEARVLQDRSTPDAILDRRIAVLLNQNPGMTVDEARAEAESNEAYQQLAATNAQYNALNERLNKAYEGIGLGDAAIIGGSGTSGEGYRIDFNLKTGEVTYTEVGGSSFFEAALGIAIAAVFTGPLAGAIAGAGAGAISGAAATAAASGIVNAATQLAMTGDVDITQALSAAATGYLNPSAAANVMSNPDVASLTGQLSNTPFNEVTKSQILGEITNASANSGAVVEAITNAVGAAATNAIFGGDDDSDGAQQPDAIENQAAGIENDDGTTTYSVFQGALPDGYIFDDTRNIVIHQETGTEYDVDTSVYGVRVTLPNIEPTAEDGGGGGSGGGGGDSSAGGAGGGADAGGADAGGDASGAAGDAASLPSGGGDAGGTGSPEDPSGSTGVRTTSTGEGQPIIWTESNPWENDPEGVFGGFILVKQDGEWGKSGTSRVQIEGSGVVIDIDWDNGTYTSDYVFGSQDPDPDDDGLDTTKTEEPVTTGGGGAASNPAAGTELASECQANGDKIVVTADGKGGTTTSVIKGGCLEGDSIDLSVILGGVGSDDSSGSGSGVADVTSSGDGSGDGSDASTAGGAEAGAGDGDGSGAEAGDGADAGSGAGSGAGDGADAGGAGSGGDADETTGDGNTEDAITGDANTGDGVEGGIGEGDGTGDGTRKGAGEDSGSGDGKGDGKGDGEGDGEGDGKGDGMGDGLGLGTGLLAGFGGGGDSPAFSPFMAGISYEPLQLSELSLQQKDYNRELNQMIEELSRSNRMLTNTKGVA